MSFAVPEYIQKKIKINNLPPGHYYNMFFDYWDLKNWEKPEKPKTDALYPLRNKFNNDLKQLKNALINRQRHSAIRLKDKISIVPCQFESPFVTGMGNPHPVENGFSFLNPYGLPYIPGSSIKGALRHAAELMALFPDEYKEDDDKNKTIIESFNIIDVWLLFGFEGQGCSLWNPYTDNENRIESELNKALKEQKNKILESNILEFFFQKQKETLKKFKIFSGQELINSLTEKNNKNLLNEINYRGAINFWDSIPDIENMEIEIMTPHYSGYYKGEDSPHDSGSPNPIPFLVIPPQSKFNLYIECLTSRLPKNYDWQSKCHEIIRFCSKWCGFGAKTAIGYGTFNLDEKAIKKEKEAKEEQKKEEEAAKRRASMTEEEIALEEFEQNFNRIKKKEENYNTNSSELSPIRNSFLKIALEWTNKEARLKAAMLLKESVKWGPPGKKKKQKIKEQISKLEE